MAIKRDDVRPSEPVAYMGRVEVPGNRPVSLHCHRGVNVHYAVANLPRAVHLGRHLVCAHVVGRSIVYRHGGHRERVRRTNQADNRPIGHPRPIRLLFDLGKKLPGFDLEDVHAPPLLS